jgi:hypothetical protein
VQGVGAVGALGGLRKQGRQRPRDEPAVGIALSAAADGERLAGSGLPIGKDAAVVAVESRAQHRQRHALENLGLAGVRRQESIKLKPVAFAGVVDEPAGVQQGQSYIPEG